MGLSAVAFSSEGWTQNPGVRQFGNVVVGNCTKWHGFNEVEDAGAACSSGAPSGPAGGDLAGTYPNPSLNTSISTAVAFGGLGNTTLLDASTLGWSNVVLRKDASNVLTLRNGANAQQLHLYNTFVSASNYGRIIVGSNGTAYVIASEQAGASSNLDLQLFGNTVQLGIVGVGVKWKVSATGDFTTQNSNAFDVGSGISGGSPSPRTVYAMTSVVTPLATLTNLTASGTADITGLARLSHGFTVATLPAAGTAGRHAYVTDQLTTCAAIGVAPTGGGAVVCPVFDNGVAWVGG